MKPVGYAAGLAVAWLLAAVGPARAEVAGLDTVTQLGPTPDAARSAQLGAFLPVTLSPRTASQAFAIGIAGYDSAQGVSLFTAATEVAVTQRLALRAGATYDTGSGARRIQPHVGLRFQVLTQSQGQGVDGAVALFYRRERYSYDEGLIQGVMSMGRAFGRLALFANFAYGQDPEGDDRDGEVRFAALYRIGDRLSLGLDSRLQIDLWSSDARRVIRNETSREIVVGPVANVSIGAWALLAQTGFSQIRSGSAHAGIVAMGGAATVF